MKSEICVFLAVLACFAYGFHMPEGEGLYRLTSSNLSMARNGEWLLIFYAPWCPHCHTLLDQLPDLKKELTSVKSAVKIGMIDADAEPSVQMQFSMKGFPSVFMANDGVVYAFPDGLPRNTETLTKWCSKDYADGVPVSGIKAPFGIPMRAFAAYSAFAISTFRFLEVYANKLGIPPMWFFCGVAVAFALSIIVIMIVTSRCRRPPPKKPEAQRKSKKTEKKDAEIAAPIVQRVRAENPIEGAAVAETEKVQEEVKKAKQEEKLRRRAVKKDEIGAREQQKRSQKNQGKPPKNVRQQQNMPTQQPSKR